MNQALQDAITRAALWLVKLPFESVKLVVRVCRYLLSNSQGSNRRLLTLASVVGVLAVARILVNRATLNRKNAMARQSVFVKRFSALGFNDDEDLPKWSRL